MWGAPPPLPQAGAAAPFIPAKNVDVLTKFGAPAQRAYRMFVVFPYGLQKVCEQSCARASIDGERGMIKYHRHMMASIRGRVPSGCGKAPAGGSGAGGPLTPPAEGKPRSPP